MPDTTLPTSEALASEQPTNTEETLKTLETRENPAALEGNSEFIVEMPEPEAPIEEEIEEELIIEDFTIDGICGVY